MMVTTQQQEEVGTRSEEEKKPKMGAVLNGGNVYERYINNRLIKVTYTETSRIIWVTLHSHERPSTPRYGSSTGRRRTNKNHFASRPLRPRAIGLHTRHCCNEGTHGSASLRGRPGLLAHVNHGKPQTWPELVGKAYILSKASEEGFQVMISTMLSNWMAKKLIPPRYRPQDSPLPMKTWS